MRENQDKRKDESPVIEPKDIERRSKQSNQDDVDEASMESFPASDAPSWSATTANAPKDKQHEKDKERRKKDH